MADDTGTAAGRGGALVRRGLRFSQLRLAAALLETRQIGAAAAQTGMTQPAASRLLSQLEGILGTPLYTRHPRGVTLTEAGRILAEQAVTTLAGLDHSHERIAQAVQGERGLVRVGSVTGPSLELVLPVIRALRTTYPEIEISVQVETSDTLAEALLAEDLDFYIGRIPPGSDVKPFSIDPIGAEPLTLVVRPDHPLAATPAPALAACLEFDWVLQPPGGLMRRTVEYYLVSRGLPLPRRIVGTTSTLFTLALVNDTDTIAPLALSVANFFIERGAMAGRLARLKVADDMAVETYGIIRRSDAPVSPAAERVLRDLTQRARGAVRTDGG